MKAIETQYKGYRFRSRVEARWAVFFDALGLRWEYEPEGFEFDDGTRYLPDFWLPDRKVWVEVKGVEPTLEEKRKLIMVCDHTECVGGVIVADLANDPPSAYLVSFQAEAFEVLKPVAPGAFALPSGPLEEFARGEHFTHILCPQCGDTYVHFGRPEYHPTDNYNAWQGRGAALRIPMYCESGHVWKLMLGFHKGYTYGRVEGMSVIDHDPLLILADADETRLAAALAAARSARFEYGEKPKLTLNGRSAP